MADYKNEFFTAYVGMQSHFYGLVQYSDLDDVPIVETKSMRLDIDELDGLDANGLKKWAVAAFDMVPDEFRDEARLEYESGDYETSPRLTIFWTQPRPQVEVQADIEAAKANQRRHQAERETAERHQYEALKAKFERDGDT